MIKNISSVLGTFLSKSQRRFVGEIAIGLAVLLALWTGQIGIDFGYHWDEPLQLVLVNQSISSATLLPSGFYNYPSMTYLLSVIAEFPQIIQRIWSSQLLTENDFTLRVRTLFLVVSSFGGVWVFAAVRRLSGSLVAVIAGSVYLFSYHYAFHSRWIAPDAILAQFCALFLFSLIVAYDKSWSPRNIYILFVVAGLAAATKYQGALLIFTSVVLVVVLGRRECQAISSLIKRVVSGISLSLITFLLVTPGALLEFRSFIDDIQYESVHYQTGHGAFAGAFPYDVHSSLRYLLLIGRYVVLDLPSRSNFLSVAVILSAAVGFAVLWRLDRLLTIVVAIPPSILILYFSFQTVFIVRNFLFLWPFIIFLGGIGLGKLFSSTIPLVRIVSIFLSLAVLIYGATFLVVAAQTIQQGSAEVGAKSLRDTVINNPSRNYALSPQADQLLTTFFSKLPTNIKADFNSGDSVVITLSQLRDGLSKVEIWPATGTAGFEVYGAEDIDFNYYPTWSGGDRFIVLSPRQIRRFGVDLRSLGFQTN